MIVEGPTVQPILCIGLHPLHPVNWAEKMAQHAVNQSGGDGSVKQDFTMRLYVQITAALCWQLDYTVCTPCLHHDTVA